jgi:hypothetical protein
VLKLDHPKEKTLALIEVLRQFRNWHFDNHFKNSQNTNLAPIPPTNLDSIHSPVKAPLHWLNNIFVWLMK